MDNVTLKELAAVSLVGFGLAKLTQAIPALNERKVLTRTMLYTLGYVIATRRPAGGYKLLGGSGV